MIPLVMACALELSQMSIEEKVGQLLMVHFNGESANEDAKTLIQEVKVGGIIYYTWANGLHSPEQVRSLSEGLQQLASIPLLIAADQEGGIVTRLTHGFTTFPGNRALGMSGNPKLAEESAYAMGQELLAVGVNFNLAPVADVNSNPRNPIIGIRAFGESPETVIPYARSALRGYHRAGILTSLKHFPGHGDVEIDSHEDLPYIHKTRAQLDALELLPFAQLAMHSDTVMTAHVMVPSIDPTSCATLSKPLLDILRHEMHFTGAIISDALVMEGLLKNCASIDEAAIRALNAGCDIVLLGGKQLTGSHTHLELTVDDVKRIRHTLVSAVKSGTISETRVDEAVQRVLHLKRGIAPVPGDIDRAAHCQLAQQIASRALRLERTVPSLQGQTLALFAPKIVQGAIEESSLLTLGAQTLSVFFEGLNPSEQEAALMQEMAQQADRVIFCSYNAWKNTAQADLIRSLLKQKSVIAIVLGDPLDTALFSGADCTLTTFSPTAPSLQAACTLLKP